MSVMIDSSMNSEYDGCQIINIRRGKGPRADIIYAQVVDKNGNLLISATLDYITAALKQRV